ncbi:RNA polymerase sigma factor, partial [Phocaeicola dorei]|uniref:RNA polymerase sigma factor n=1 Tax=Phocaeicola dorei TaxID=357276 RepID=UPI0002692F98
MNETELVERCGKGDNLARKQLYERYAGQLMAICVRYTGDREVAQDVLHDGFLNIGKFYQFNLSSCIRQQNSLTAQFVSFSLSNL